jgi:hypothetical protein
LPAMKLEQRVIIGAQVGREALFRQWRG